MPEPPFDAPDSALSLAISPGGALLLDREPIEDPAASPPLPPEVSARIAAAFEEGAAAGVVHLATVELATELPPSLGFGREIGARFFAVMCRLPDLEEKRASLRVPAPEDEIAELVAVAPPLKGAEYLTPDALAAVWSAVEARVGAELQSYAGPVEQYLHEKSPGWNVMGRVSFHLAENRGSDEAPFAFVATYAKGLTKQGRVQYAKLGAALKEHAGPERRAELLRLLEPVRRAAQASDLVRGLVASGEIYHPLAWTPAEAYAFLREAPALESSGVVVRLPDWWRARRRMRPQVKVTIGAKQPSAVGADALLDFDVGLTLDGESLSPHEWSSLLEGAQGLRLIRGRWVEVDSERLRQVLHHFREVERSAAGGGIGFLEGMRMLAGMPEGGEDDAAEVDDTAAWSRVAAGPWLEELLADLQSPHGSREADPGPDLKGTLRPYQRDGVAWLHLLSRLGLGACLADDMGLGKTIQVLSLLLLLKQRGQRGPHLLVVPASLLGNWRAEMDRFAPSLVACFAHPSYGRTDITPADIEGVDLVVTTYGTLLRAPGLATTEWGLVALDEAQAIKNPSAKQTRAVKALKSRQRLALTGTPVENRLGDLWSLFDFLCPGLLGSAVAFRTFARKIGKDSSRGYAPLKNLVRPYILRRMKSDKHIAADLPDKIEVNVYCPLTRSQAALYRESVTELAASLQSSEGIQRRGLILSYLLRFKQICNHPSQWLGDGAYEPDKSGKMIRLRELCESIAARQEKVLVFTQFREMTAPLADFLREIFGKPGLVLHGETKVKDRAALVADFQREEGPPFFVLSLKAGGTGLNLTAASHVIHFDRWWNPAVESQATDRAYRIGQKKNVLVHKLVCRGTVEERIDALIASKVGLSREILADGGEAWLTEMESDELLRMVSLDLSSALSDE